MKLWQVKFISDDNIYFRFIGDSAIYQYWDATDQVEFGFRMAQKALDEDLRNETDFLMKFNVLYKAIDNEFDIRNNDLVVLVRSCIQNDGRVSNNRRRQFSDRVTDIVFDALEEKAREVLSGDLTVMKPLRPAP